MRRLFAVVVAAFLVAGCATQQALPEPKSEKQDFDNLIVPGQRIGPVAMGGYVDEIQEKLGKPDRVHRSTYRDNNAYDADEVWYTYNRNCIRFTWMDKGLRPVVESGFRGINVDCPRWATAGGIRVGSSIQEVMNAYGSPNKVESCKSGADAECVLMYNSGIWFRTKDRNSPVREINIVPAMDYSRM